VKNSLLLRGFKPRQSEPWSLYTLGYKNRADRSEHTFKMAKGLSNDTSVKYHEVLFPRRGA
jgi:hypothetical protein